MKKRHIKVGIFYLLIFTVSFFTLTSCGIPNPFYLPNVANNSNSSYYIVNNSLPNNARLIDLEYKIDIGDYKFADNEKIPSLAFFYAIVPVISESSKNNIANVYKNLFNSKYVNNNNGLPITSVDVLKSNFGGSIGDITLRKFNLYDSSNNLLNTQLPNDYGLISNLSSDLTLTNNIYSKNNVKLSVNPNRLTDGSFEIVLNQDPITIGGNTYSFRASNSNYFTSINLRPYNNNIAFPNVNNAQVFKEIEDNSQYSVLIFTAMTVKSVNYTNIFWSELQYLGSISSSD